MDEDTLKKIKKLRIRITKNVVRDGKKRRVKKTDVELMNDLDRALRKKVTTPPNLPNLVPNNKSSPGGNRVVAAAKKLLSPIKPPKKSTRLSWLLGWTRALLASSLVCHLFCAFCFFHYKKFYVYEFGEAVADEWFHKWASWFVGHTNTYMSTAISEFIQIQLSPLGYGTKLFAWVTARGAVISLQSTLTATIHEIFYRAKSYFKPHERLYAVFRMCNCYTKAKSLVGKKGSIRDLEKLTRKFITKMNGEFAKLDMLPHVLLPHSHIVTPNLPLLRENMKKNMNGRGNPGMVRFQNMGYVSLAHSLRAGALASVPLAALRMIRR